MSDDALLAPLDLVEQESRRRQVWTMVAQWVSRDERPEGVHASDIVAVRRAYFRMVDPQPLSDREVGLFFVGRVLHAFLLAVRGEELRSEVLSDSAEPRWSEALGLWYTPDAIDPDGVPVEIKTSRALFLPRRVSDLSTYLNQLIVYMAAMQSVVGRLWVLFLSARAAASGRTEPALRCYEARMTPDALTHATQRIRSVRDRLVEAVERRDPSALPLCPEWMCGEEVCGWWRTCRPAGRYRA